MAFAVEGYVPATGGGPSSAFYNAVRDAPVDPTVPEMMEDTRSLVEEFFTTNREFADDAIALALQTIEDLKESILPPDLPAPPAAPQIITRFEAELGIGFGGDTDLGGFQPQTIEEFNPDLVELPDIEGTMPAYTGLVYAITIPPSPTLEAVPEPAAPVIDTAFEIGSPPVQDIGGAPDLDEIVLPTYTAPVIPTFDGEPPSFNVAPPNPVIQWTEPTYTSELKTAVAAVLQTMLAGGTGLAPDVENAIWDRLRAREERAGQARIAAAYMELEARGWERPQGVLDALVESIRQDVEAKLNAASRDVAIEQAQLEQKNRQFAVQATLDYERIFTAIFLAITERNFEIAKFHVETEIQVYNLQITAFNVERQVFEAKIAKFRADLDAALAYLKMFEALVEVEKAKAAINVAKVQAYEAQVKAYGARVEAYKALVQAAGVHADAQKAKADVYRAQIEGMVAKLGAQRAKFELFDAQVRGEESKVRLEGVNAQVFATRVQAWGQTADKLLKRADLDFQQNQQQLNWNIANMQRVTAFSGQELNAIQARLAAYQANTSRSTAKFQADASVAQADLQAQVTLSQLSIARFQALLEEWKTRSQEIIQYGLATAESLRSTGQIVSTMLSGTLAGLHVSAGISAGASAGQSSSRTSSDQTSQSKSTNENNNYSITHNYQHRT